MAELSGMHEASVDDRYRVAIPARLLKPFREIAGVADPEAPTDVVVGMGMGKNLSVYPRNVHQQLVDYLRSKPRHDADWMRLRTWILGTAEEQTLDKQNRFRIPSLLAKKMKLTEEVVITGVEDHLELMGKGSWEQDFEKYLEEFEQTFKRALDMK